MDLVVSNSFTIGRDMWNYIQTFTSWPRIQWVSKPNIYNIIQTDKLGSFMHLSIKFSFQVKYNNSFSLYLASIFSKAYFSKTHFQSLFFIKIILHTKLTLFFNHTFSKTHYSKTRFFPGAYFKEKLIVNKIFCNEISHLPICLDRLALQLHIHKINMVMDINKIHK